MRRRNYTRASEVLRAIDKPLRFPPEPEPGEEFYDLPKPEHRLRESGLENAMGLVKDSNETLFDRLWRPTR